MLPTPPKDRVQVRFVNIGQGDCTYIISPSGKRILVDAGNRGWGNATIATVRRDLFCLMTGEMVVPLEILVLTHNDDDHYNKIGAAVGGAQINRIYYSNIISRYGANDFRKWRWQFRPYQLTGALVNEWLPITVNPNHPVPQVIFQENSDNGQTFTLTVLASNVEVPGMDPNGDDRLQKNTRSVVVKGSFAGNSFIIGADATEFTENFLAENSGTQPLSDLASEVVRVPHHGSADSSTNDFVTGVDPQFAIISCKDRGSSKYKIPRRSAVEQYTNLVSLDAANHAIGYYNNLDENGTAFTGGNMPYQTINTTAQVYETGTNGTQVFFFLQDGTYYRE